MRESGRAVLTPGAPLHLSQDQPWVGAGCGDSGGPTDLFAEHLPPDQSRLPHPGGSVALPPRPNVNAHSGGAESPRSHVDAGPVAGAGGGAVAGPGGAGVPI
jgi:hypothetical protein